MTREDTPSREDPPLPPAGVADVVADVLARRTRGETVSDADVIARHPDLMPQLVEELQGLRMLQQAYLAAQKAGPIDEPLPPLALGEIDDPIQSGAAPVLPVGPEPPAALPGVLGYTPLREISSGGQATVYLAVQQPTGRKVAIKILPGGPFVSSVNRTRFDREADILANLDHPNIVGILDRGRTPDGSFYLVMPYVDGTALDAYAADCRQSDPQFPARVLRVFVKTARAVQEAHGLGVIHRDLKPSNVLVDRRGEPHLLDFGLARLETAVAPVDWRTHTLTASGQVVGSLPWASPEQASGRSAKVDARSDVYSLGACLYESLTGRLPYPADGSMKEMLDHIVSSPPIPFGRTKARIVAVDADALERVVMRALAKSPGERHASAARLASDLEALLDGGAVAPAPPRAGARRRRWAAVVAACLGAIGGTLWYTRPWQAARPPVVVYELPWATNTIGIRLLRISPGPSQMGTPGNARERNDDERWHLVRITRPFWLAQCEVTRGQYRELMGGPPEGTPDGDWDLPATGVTWDQAVEFCRLLGEREKCRYRLPTEAEWEYACRAGTGSAWSGDDDADHMGWHGGNSNGVLHPPAGKAQNHWGLYDMHGNAAEWCEDGYNAVYPTNEIDPLFRDNPLQRVVRGGSFATPASETRSSARGREFQQRRRPDIGFRIVREPDEGRR